MGISFSMSQFLASSNITPKWSSPKNHLFWATFWWNFSQLQDRLHIEYSKAKISALPIFYLKTLWFTLLLCNLLLCIVIPVTPCYHSPPDLTPIPTPPPFQRLQLLFRIFARFATHYFTPSLSPLLHFALIISDFPLCICHTFSLTFQMNSTFGNSRSCLFSCCLVLKKNAVQSRGDHMFNCGNVGGSQDTL